MKIMFLGAPGAGKGTRAEKVAAELHIPQISTGEILRKAIAEKTPMGVKAQSFIENGDLVPDEVVIEIVKERLAEPDCANGYILDGFPRTIPQAEALEKFAQLDHVIEVRVAKEIIVDRLSGRRYCPKCGHTTHIEWGEKVCAVCGGELIQRKDDAPESIRQRLAVYEEQTAPLIDFYNKKGIMKVVSGMGKIEDNLKEIMRVLGC